MTLSTFWRSCAYSLSWTPSAMREFPERKSNGTGGSSPYTLPKTASLVFARVLIGCMPARRAATTLPSVPPTCCMYLRIMEISVRFILSVMPFICGWCVLAIATRVPVISHNSRHTAESNYVPRSEIITLGHPCAATIIRSTSYTVSRAMQ